jgi:hypothetical protein
MADAKVQDYLLTIDNDKEAAAVLAAQTSNGQSLTHRKTYSAYSSVHN